MDILKSFSFKTVISTGLVAILLGTTVGCTVAGPGYDNRPIYRDNNNSTVNYNRVSQQLRQDLRRKGYQVMDIKSDDYRGNRALIAHARKNNQNYELRYTYPSLRLINSNRTSWSNNGQKDRYKKDHYKKDKHKNNGKHKGKYKHNKHH
jgi:hypothetical protein